MAPGWAEKLHKAMKERVNLSQTITFNGDGNIWLEAHWAGAKIESTRVVTDMPVFESSSI